MNKGDLIRYLERSVNRPDMADAYVSWINQALRGIYRDHSFLCMSKRVTVTMLSGTSQIILPSDFKELMSERSPVYVQGSDGLLLPCDVTRESTERRLLTANQTIVVPTSPSTLFRDLPVWISYDATSAYLNSLYAAVGNLPFLVKYFAYLADLVNDTDTNYITSYYEEMVKAKVSAVAFEELRDPEWENQEKIYEDRKSRAMADDLYRAQKGRRTQLGS